jgi:hypothetical protein
MTTAEHMRDSQALIKSGIPPRPAYGHMPFVGHRTQHTIFLIQKAASRNARLRLAMEFGFEPDADSPHG